jgi:hypothetical protein
MVTKRFPITIDGEAADIGTVGELMVALDVLQGQHDRAVLEQLRPRLADVIGSPQGLHAVLKVLEPEDQMYLVEALGPRLVDVVQRATALRDILATLAESGVEEKLLQTLGADGVRALIGSAEELAGVLEWVYGASDWLVLQLLGADSVNRLFQNGYELSLVLHSLDHARQQDLIDWLGWDHVVFLVHDRRDLAHLLRALPADLSNRLLTHFTEAQLWSIIQDEHGRRYLYNYLETAEVDYLSKVLEVNDAE